MVVSFDALLYTTHIREKGKKWAPGMMENSPIKINKSQKTCKNKYIEEKKSHTHTDTHTRTHNLLCYESTKQTLVYNKTIKNYSNPSFGWKIECVPLAMSFYYIKDIIDKIGLFSFFFVLFYSNIIIVIFLWLLYIFLIISTWIILVFYNHMRSFLIYFHFK